MCCVCVCVCVGEGGEEATEEVCVLCVCVGEGGEEATEAPAKKPRRTKTSSGIFGAHYLVGSSDNYYNSLQKMLQTGLPCLSHQLPTAPR